MCNPGVVITLNTPDIDGLRDVIRALGNWQRESAPFQLHPGDIGWFARFGADATAAAIRMWSRDRRILAAGLLDGDDLLRLAIAPDLQQDDALAEQLAADIIEPARGVLGTGRVSVEAPPGARLRDHLTRHGWELSEAWTPLRRDLRDPVQDPGVRIEVVGPELAGVRAALQRAAFATSTFTEDHWHVMAAGLAYTDARCLVAFDDDDNAVATVTVWSAGPDKPGLIEPMGVHRDHRGQGFGTAITLAAAASLQGLGSTSVTVCTPSANVGGVATYLAAGLAPQPARRDLCRAS